MWSKNYILWQKALDNGEIMRFSKIIFLSAGAKRQQTLQLLPSRLILAFGLFGSDNQTRGYDFITMNYF